MTMYSTVFWYVTSCKQNLDYGLHLADFLELLFDPENWDRTILRNVITSENIHFIVYIYRNVLVFSQQLIIYACFNFRYRVPQLQQESMNTKFDW
jgi:hypothetical protein